MSNCCSDDQASKQERGATPSVAGAKSIVTLAAAHLAGKGTQEQTRGGSHKHEPKNIRPEAGCEEGAWSTLNSVRTLRDLECGSFPYLAGGGQVITEAHIMPSPPVKLSYAGDRDKRTLTMSSRVK